MKTVSFRGREDKLAIVSELFGPYLKGDVLDVGCDEKHLASSVHGRYVGVDIAGQPDLKINLEYGLPFKARSFDTVVAFDVLEHLECVHDVFDELCRVARQYVILGLPNMYEWSFRVKYMLGRRISGKYGLPPEKPLDRHRWLFGLHDARAFVSSRAMKQGFSVVHEVFVYYRYRRILPKLVTALGQRLAPRLASVFAYHYWAVLQRNNEKA